MVSTYVGPDAGINDRLTFDQNANLCGTDHEGNGIYRVLPSGEVLEIAQTNMHPNAIVCDDAGNLYFSEPQGNKIHKIAPDGQVSQYGPDIANPNGLIFDRFSDTLYGKMV